MKSKSNPETHSGVVSMMCPECGYTKSAILQLMANSIRYCCENKYCNEVFIRKIYKEPIANLHSALKQYEASNGKLISS